MDIAGLLAEAITKHRNAMPLPNTPGAPSFHGIDVTIFLHKYECLARFTGTDPSSKDIISMFPFYCAENSDVREMVMMMRGYLDRDWTALKKELLDTFRHADSRALIYTRQHLEELCAKFTDSRHHSIQLAGFQNTDALKSFLRTYNHINGVVTERGMMCEYERTEILLRALPKRLWRKAITKLGINPLEPHTFNYCKLKNWIDTRCSAAEALAMFEFLASPTSTVTAPLELTTSPAPTAHSPSPTSPAPTASVTPMAPTISTTAHKSPAATDMTSTSSGTASPMTSTVPTTPTAFTPPARTHTARQGTIRAGPMVRLGIIRVEPPQGQKIRRHHYAQPEPIRPHRTESTVTCRSEPARSNRPKPMQPHGQEPAPPNRQEPVKLPRSEPIVPSHNQPVSPNRQQPVPPYRQEPVQPPQQVDRPPCYYCADDQHNLRKCTDLRTDLGKGIVSINNRDRLLLGTAGAEIPMAPAARDYRTIRDYARAGAPILSAPAPVPTPLPPSPVPAPSPASQPAPLQTPPPARPSRTSVPLLSPEQLTQLMREVSEHFARSRQYGVDVSPPPPQPPVPSPQKARPAHPSPAARKARKLEQQRSICV
ncbi:hypothetical protein K440DRAFT_286346 [Wilcoxina mikolae CBS 423.85]|nr:hypothetical protein K440DRAFT_286346 [Wilcoxina mikolae CBS 423.85]